MSKANDLSDPPRTARIRGAWQYGRYRAPIEHPAIGDEKPWQRLRLKEWHYASVTTDRWFVALAVVNLGYAAEGFCYVVDRRDGTHAEWAAIAPPLVVTSFAPSSVRGTTRMARGRDRIELTARDGWDVEVDVDLRGERLRGSFHVASGEALALLHPLEPGRPAYTHKAAALRASGLLEWGSRTIELSPDEALANVDWTRSLARRETRWRWASLSTRLASGSTLGLNLSSDVYDDAFGDSRENALWVDGVVEPLGGAVFELPPDPAHGIWRIRSRAGDELDLEVRPLGARRRKLDIGLLRVSFVQPFGTWSGRVRDHRLDGAFGVVEDHVSVW